MRLISPIALACAGLLLSACGGGDGGSSLSPQASPASNAQNTASKTAAAAAASASPACGINGTSPLAGVQTWMYQLQGMTTSAQIDALDAQPYDMLVIDANNTIKRLENFNRAHHGRNLGENRRLIPGPGSDLEHAVGTVQT